MPRPDFPKTILEFQQRFSTEEACREYLFKCRWPEGFACPRCGGQTAWYKTTRPLIRCAICKHDASLTAGTVMQDTRQPLVLWFWAAHLVATLTPGVSALQLQRQLGISRYETAFNMLHKLRSAMVRPGRDRIKGIVEVDETYVGGPHAGKRGRGAEGKVIVAGAIEVLDEGAKKTQQRVGRLRLRVIPDVSAKSLVGFVKANVEPGSIVLTDDLRSYEPLTAAGYSHAVVDAKEGMDHMHRTFSNLKTWLEGTHHGVSEQHLQAYLNEFCFRHNRRRTPMAAFQTVLGLASHPEGPTYRKLYGVASGGGWTHPNP